MFIKLGKVKHLLPALLLSVGLPLTVLSEGHEDNNQQGQNNGGGGGNPTPTPTPGGTATPAPTPTPTANPLNSGPAADETSSDNRYVTVELQTEHPQYTNRGYKATDLSVNSLIHYSARLATFRGFYTGSNRGSGSNPPSTGPITTQLTQASAPAPTPTPSPGQKVRKKKTAKQFSDDGNDNNVQQTGQN